MQRLANQFIAGRAVLFAQRITDRRIVDGHADLLADDIFCMPDGPALLDCLEFDDRPALCRRDRRRRVSRDGSRIPGSKGSRRLLPGRYSRLAGDTAPRSLKDFYIAYRAVVRAKVDCVRVSQGHPDAAADARRHLDIALEHLRAGTVRLILIGGGPGTGKTTLAHCVGRTDSGTGDFHR